MHGVLELIQAVDAFLEAPKNLATGMGQLQWGAARDECAKRLKLPLEIEGEQHGHHLVIDAFPNSSSLKFCLAIQFGEHVVDRIDYELTVRHANQINSGLPQMVKGPHWHKWSYNRNTFKRKDNFLKLPNASAFETPRQFDATLRMFCADNNIAIGNHGIELPPRDSLL
jgi:hypothetical protein